jgi:hypothetical protein
MFTPELTQAILRIIVAGAVAGLFGGLVGNVRASVLGSVLMGAIGGVSLAVIVRIANLDPFGARILDAGQGFSYAWAGIGGLILGYVTTKSSG